jgi:Spy/CpxP family protein refolding chaperone
MKKIITITAILFLAVAATQAQDVKTNHEKDHQRHGKTMEKHKGQKMDQLNLTDAQKQQMKANKEHYKKQLAELKKNDNITVKEYRSQMETLKKQQRQEMQNLLTSEQKSQLEKNRQQRAAQYSAMAKQRNDQMKAQLGLTNEQAKKLADIRKDNAEKMRSIRENTTLDRTAKQEQMKALKEQQKEATKSILTPDQLQKMKDQKKVHKNKRGPKKNK